MNAAILQTGTFFGFSFEEPVIQLAVAAVLGLFLGLEREWSEKSAGVRTFSLISLSGATATLLEERTGAGAELLAVGGILVVMFGGLLAVRGLREADGDAALSLTTTVSMFVAYGVGALTAAGLVLEGVTVAVLSSVLLVLTTSRMVQPPVILSSLSSS